MQQLSLKDIEFYIIITILRWHLRNRSDLFIENADDDEEERGKSSTQDRH